jgi:hypothetical protein
MSDLRLFAERVEAKYKIKTLQIYIHRDEGHKATAEDIAAGLADTPGEFICNHHAHIVFDWMDHATGKSIKINRQQMSDMQTMLAETLKMERGVSSDKKHLSAIQYKTMKAEQAAIAAERDVALSVAKASAVRSNLAALEAPLEEVINTAEEKLIQPLMQSRWDAVKLLFRPRRYMGKIRAKIAIVEANFKQIIRERQRAEVGLRIALIEKSEMVSKLKLTPEQIKALASKQTIVLKNITRTYSDKTAEKMDIDICWNEKTKTLSCKENEAWRQNKAYQERMRQIREHQEHIWPKRGKEPPQGEQQKSRGLKM